MDSDSPRRRPRPGHSDRPEPAGFGNCGECAYRFAGSVDTCYQCASNRLEELADDRCDTCEGRLTADDACRNPLCNRDVDERGWSIIWAIAMRSGPLSSAINDYKYEGKWGWAHIFGRVLAGYLQSEEDMFDATYDLIIPMPTYVGDGGRDFDHTAMVLERAQVEDPDWPYRFDVMRKTAATPPLAGARRFYDRARIVEDHLAPALEVTDPAAVEGASVLVFDDVFTGGLTLRETAFKLKAAGARRVDGIVLARQPFHG